MRVLVCGNERTSPLRSEDGWNGGRPRPGPTTPRSRWPTSSRSPPPSSPTRACRARAIDEIAARDAHEQADDLLPLRAARRALVPSPCSRRRYRRIRAIEAEPASRATWRPEDACASWSPSPSTTSTTTSDFIRLVMNENIHRGEYLRAARIIQELNVPAIERGAARSTSAASRRASSAGTWTRSTCTCRSRRCASSTSPTGTRSR